MEEIIKENEGTLDFLISVDPQITVDPGKVPKNNKHRHPNKHRPWKIWQMHAPQIKVNPRNSIKTAKFD